MLLNTVYTSLFAFFVLISFLIAYFMDVGPVLRSKVYKPLLTVLFVSTVAGIIYDFMYDAPWTGTFLATAFGEVSISREWWSQGITRSAGFTRESTTAALLTGLVTINLVMLFRGFKLRVMIFLVGVAAVSLTTSKATLGAKL